jgi:hypothetical protein
MSNKKAWMNTTFMCEWLQKFFSHIGSIWEVLPTMDNFSAHYSAIELSPPSNIRICWLPTNSTSRFQPLDQGIFRTSRHIISADGSSLPWNSTNLEHILNQQLIYVLQFDGSYKVGIMKLQKQ